MIFLLVISFLWGLAWVGFVLAPLFSREGRSTRLDKIPTSKTFKSLIILFGFVFFSGNGTGSVTVPGPTILPGSGVWVPSVNQYVLVPQEGYLEVYYVGMFSNTFAAKGTTLLLPLPQGFEKLELLESTAGIQLLPSSGETGTPRLYVPLISDLNQIRATFRLRAPWGKVVWQAPADLAILPGVALILFSQTGEQPLSPQLVPMPPAGFQLIVGETLQLIRADRTGMAAFPSFAVENIVPSRSWVSAFALFFALLLLTPLLGRVIFSTLPAKKILSRKEAP